MNFTFLLFEILLCLNYVKADHRSKHGGNTLLSLISPSWNFRRFTNVGLNPPKCSVDPKYYYHKSPNMFTYGIHKNFTAVLTGYGPNQDKTRPRANKGFLYGWNNKVKPTINGKAEFLFYSDLELPKLLKGQYEEFCCHIYSPPLKMGPSAEAALGTTVFNPKRNFGSDEKLDLIIRRESNNNSKKITSCCFVLKG